MFNKTKVQNTGTIVARYEELLADFCDHVEKVGILQDKPLYIRACHLLGRPPISEEDLVSQSIKNRRTS